MWVTIKGGFPKGEGILVLGFFVLLANDGGNLVRKAVSMEVSNAQNGLSNVGDYKGRFSQRRRHLGFFVLLANEGGNLVRKAVSENHGESFVWGRLMCQMNRKG